jgi:hypothetical protein
LPGSVATFLGAMLCFGLRVAAVRRGWHLPIAGETGQAVPEPYVAAGDESDAPSPS